MTTYYLLVVMHQVDGRRYSFVGSKAECEAEAEAKRKEWGKKDTEVLIEKR